MCNRYVSPTEADIERYWHVGRQNQSRWWDEVVAPRRQGVFIRLNTEGRLELVAGQWALVPAWAKSPKLEFSTNNCRAEEMANKPTYRDAWNKGQRCIIPALSFDEPNWETGKNIWWRFGRADGAPWGLAGLWNTWVDHKSGQIVESYTMLTINADDHPIMSRMHKPDPKLPPDQQDKRSVIAIELAQVEHWLADAKEDLSQYLTAPDVSVIDAKPLT